MKPYADLTPPERAAAWREAVEEQHFWAGLTQHMRLHGTDAEWVSATAEFQRAIFWAHACAVRLENARREEQKGARSCDSTQT